MWFARHLLITINITTIVVVVVVWWNFACGKAAAAAVVPRERETIVSWLSCCLLDDLPQRRRRGRHSMLSPVAAFINSHGSLSARYWLTNRQWSDFSIDLPDIRSPRWLLTRSIEPAQYDRSTIIDRLIDDRNRLVRLTMMVDGGRQHRQCRRRRRTQQGQWKCRQQQHDGT